MNSQPKRIILIIIYILLGVLAVVGLISLAAGQKPVPSQSPSVTPTPTAQATPTPTPTQTKKEDLSIAVFSELRIIDPHYAQTDEEKIIAAQVFDSIYQAEMNDYSDLQPVLVTGYEKSNNNKTYTFTIKKDVSFHNGDALTVEDIVYSIQRQKDSRYTSETLSEVVDAKVVDNSKFSVTFKTGFETNLNIMADIRIVNKKLCELYNPGSAELAIGTGAYKIVQQSADTVKLQAVNTYHMSVQPYFKTVQFLVFGDRADAMQSLKDGSIDIITNCTVEEFIDVQNNRQLRITTLKSRTFHYIAINSFDQDIFYINKIDINIRKAINYALDRDLINRNANDQTGYTADDLLIPRAMAGYTQNTAKYRYNTESAKNYIRYAGYNKGITLSLIYRQGEYWSNLAESIKECLKESNINIKLEQLTDTEFNARIANYNYELALQEYTVTSHNPYTTHYELFNSKGKHNTSRIFNEDLDEKIEIAGALNSVEKSRATLEDIQKTVREEAYYAPLYTITQSEIANKYVAGNVGSPHVGINYIYLMYWDEEALWQHQNSIFTR